MVSVKGDRGFHRIREYNDGLDETNLSSQQKAIIRYYNSEKGKQTLKRYLQSEKGKQKMCEMNKKNIVKAKMVGKKIDFGAQ